MHIATFVTSRSGCGAAADIAVEEPGGPGAEMGQDREHDRMQHFVTRVFDRNTTGRMHVCSVRYCRPNVGTLEADGVLGFAAIYRTVQWYDAQ